MTTNRPEFKAHDEFIFEHKKIGKVTREEFIKYIRSSNDHMRKLSQTIQQYDQTIDEYLNEWDGRLESFDDDVKVLLGQWINDGTMDHIINENLMSTKADKEYVDELHDSTTAQLAQKMYKGRGEVTSADLSQEVKEQMTGGSVAVVGENSVGSENLKRKSVTGDKTTFIKTGKNLFDKENLLNGYVNWHSGGIVANPTLRATNYFIPVTTATPIVVSPINSGYSPRIAFYGAEDKETFISGHDFSSNTQATIPEGTAFARFSISEIATHMVQIEYGTTPTEYESYIEEIKTDFLPKKEEYVKPENTTFVKYADVEDKTYATENLSTFYEPSNDNTLWDINNGQKVSSSGYVALNPTYTEGNQIYRARYRNVLFFDETDNLIGYDNNSARDSQGKVVFKTFTTPATTRMIRVSIDMADVGSTIVRRTPFENERKLVIPNLEIYGGNSENRFVDKKIIQFGDSLTGNSSVIGSTIRNRLGVEILNGGIGGAKMAERNDTTQTVGGGHTANSGVRIAEAIVSGDFSKQYEYTNAQYGGGTLTLILNTLDLLENTNFNEVDYATVQFGANDYLQGVPIGTVDGNRYTFMGAYRIFLETLLEEYPNIKPLLVSTPMIFSEPPKSIEMSEYIQATKEVAKHFNLPFLDNYTNAGINQMNRYEFFGPTDGIHPDERGLNHLGNRIASSIALNY